jgi:threonine/homoserine/homoserine lactone efflux protein
VLDLSDLASFAVVAGLLTIIPGIDTALVVRTTVAQGRRRGFAAAVGICTGCLIWGAAAAVGVSALLVASRLGYDAVRAAGAVYLTWLGATMLWRTRTRNRTRTLALTRGCRDAPPLATAPGDTARLDTQPRDTAPRDSPGCRPTSPRPADSAFRSWLRGTTTNLLNPKIGAFYVAILPQFIPAHASHLLMGLVLAGIHDAEGLIWFTGLISAAHLARRFLDSNRARQIMDRVTGTVLIGFGLKLALSSR